MRTSLAPPTIARNKLIDPAEEPVVMKMSFILLDNSWLHIDFFCYLLLEI
jgi:hypothetical protein